MQRGRKTRTDDPVDASHQAQTVIKLEIKKARLSTRVWWFDHAGRRKTHNFY